MVVRRLTGGLLIALLAALTLPGALLTDLVAGLRTAPVATPARAGPLPWLHVEHPAGGRPYIADRQGREIILRGVVSAGLVDYWSGADPASPRPPPTFPIDPAAYDGRCPANTDTVSQPPLCRADLAQMRALGFDVVRLAISWSLLEPRPGAYDERYLDRIAQVVGWARDEGIYVILDMHEDGYSRFLARPVPPPLPGGTPTALNRLDGAPAWATLTDGWPSEVYLGQRELNPAVFSAFTNFWVNRHVDEQVGAAPGSGLQDHYIGALAALARRFRADSTVAGYDLLNEPWAGIAPPPLFEDLFLYPFYRRVIDALAGTGDGLPCPASSPALAVCGYPDLGVHDRAHLFFVEPDHLREDTDFPTSVPLPFSSSPNLVYTIHAYTHIFTLDALTGQGSIHAGYPPGGFATSYATADAEARAMHAALFVGEFGGAPAQDDLVASQLREQERYRVGATLWPWKESCALGSPWGVFAGVFTGSDQRCAYDRPAAVAASTPQNGCLRTDRERLLARPWPRALASGSTGVAYGYDPATGSFHFSATAPRGATDTLVFVPGEVRGAVTVGGSARVVGTAEGEDGSRLVQVRPRGGTYTIAVAPARLALLGCSLTAT